MQLYNCFGWFIVRLSEKRERKRDRERVEQTLKHKGESMLGKNDLFREKLELWDQYACMDKPTKEHKQTNHIVFTQEVSILFKLNMAVIIENGATRKATPKEFDYNKHEKVLVDF